MASNRPFAIPFRQPLLVAALCVVTHVAAQEPGPAPAPGPALQSVSAMCRTPAAAGDGVAYRCVSEPSRVRAPEGYAFLQSSLKGGVADSAGPEPRCEVEWSEHVALAPGAEAREPRLLGVRASASSQRGYGRRGPGWTNCSYTVEVVPYTAE